MHSAVYTLFSVHLGALLALLTATGFDGFVRGSRSSRGAFAYVAISLLTTIFSSGWLEFAMDWHGKPAAEFAVAWLIPMLLACTTLAGIIGIRQWLGFPWRGKDLDQYFLTSRSALIASAGLCALVPLLPLAQFSDLAQSGHWVRWATVAAGLVALLVLAACCWVCIKMTLLGDRLSAWLTASTLMIMPGVVAIGSERGLGLVLGPWIWGPVATLHVLSLMCAAFAAVLQNAMRNDRRRAAASATSTDELARLVSGEQLISAFGLKFDRMNALGSTPAVLLVNVFNHDAIAAERGGVAAHQVALATLARMRAVLNPNDLLGRYFDSCFVVLIRAQVDTHYLREVTMRLATAVRRDVALRGIHGDDATGAVELDVGVGLCWSDRVTQLAQAMQEAGTASNAARLHASRAFVVIYPEHPPLPIEAVLGGEVVTQPV